MEGLALGIVALDGDDVGAHHQRSGQIVASYFFGGISGSAAADTASIGSIMIPMMVDQGYDAD